MTSKELSDNDVINYLISHSDFFVRHPEQLEVLKVSNKNGSVTSLVNHQVNVLKDRNTQLKAKLYELISFAEENEKIMSQVFELTLQLCQISHVANVTKHFGLFVKKSFDSDMFKIVLPQYDNLDSSQSVLCVGLDKEKEFLSIFKDFINNSVPICGRLKKEKLDFIFGKYAYKVGSCVILPIGEHANKGLLVFASFDENRFNPEISTDLLSRLTHILDRKFNKTFHSTLVQKVQS
ncbi:MAG: DUF484 family protein [Alcanivoracaceae bacterium]|nr:DUF484 family protein [Alcanivoracaceae bacterium]